MHTLVSHKSPDPPRAGRTILQWKILHNPTSIKACGLHPGVCPKGCSFSRLPPPPLLCKGLAGPWSHTGTSLRLSCGPWDHALLHPVLGQAWLLAGWPRRPWSAAHPSHALTSLRSQKKQRLNSNLRISPRDPTSTEPRSQSPGAPGPAPQSTDRFPSALSNHGDSWTGPGPFATSPWLKPFQLEPFQLEPGISPAWELRRGRAVHPAGLERASEDARGTVPARGTPGGLGEGFPAPSSAASSSAWPGGA